MKQKYIVYDPIDGKVIRTGIASNPEEQSEPGMALLFLTPDGPIPDPSGIKVKLSGPTPIIIFVPKKPKSPPQLDLIIPDLKSMLPAQRTQWVQQNINRKPNHMQALLVYLLENL